MNRSKFRGYIIEQNCGKWIFADTGLSTEETWINRPCGTCGLYNTKEGYDGCIGKLDDVINACCGHGEQEEAYIQFSDHSELRGKDAIVFISTIIKERELNE